MYSGIQNRAYDTAVNNDFKNLAKKFELFKVENGRYPVTAAEMTSLQLKVAKSAYGNGFLNNNYNLAYCRLGNNPQEFTLFAGSKSGNIFVYQKDGSITSSKKYPPDSPNKCAGTGINSTTFYDYDNFYGGTWDTYIGG